MPELYDGAIGFNTETIEGWDFLSPDQQTTLLAGYTTTKDRRPERPIQLVETSGFETIKGHRLRNLLSYYQRMDTLIPGIDLSTLHQDPETSWVIASKLVFQDVVNSVVKYSQSNNQYTREHIEEYLGKACELWFIYLARETQVVYALLMADPNAEYRIGNEPDQTCHSCTNIHPSTGLAKHCSNPFPEEDSNIVTYMIRKKERATFFEEKVLPLRYILESSGLSELKTLSNYIIGNLPNPEDSEFFTQGNALFSEIVRHILQQHGDATHTEQMQFLNSIFDAVAAELGVDLSRRVGHYRDNAELHLRLMRSVASEDLREKLAKHDIPDWTQHILSHGSYSYEYDPIHFPGQTTLRHYCIVQGGLLKSRDALEQIIEDTRQPD